MKRFYCINLLFVMSFALVSALLSPACTPTTNNEQTNDASPADNAAGDNTPSFEKLSADGYTTVSNVTIHNKVPQDISEIRTMMAAATVNWDQVQQMYEKGKHSVKSDGSIRTLNGFASSPGNFKDFSPDAVAYFKDKGICQLAPVQGFECTEGKFVDEYVEAYAMKGTGPFKDASDQARAAAVDAGLMVLMSYWIRLEFGKAMNKAKDNEYEPLEGAPHNWDEAFAFYWGPSGKHSLYQLADELSSKYNLSESINKAFFTALIEGLTKLTAKEAPADAQAAGNKQLIRLFVLGSLDAAKELDAATDDKAKAAARWRGFGYWQAIGHAVANANADAATTFQDVFFTKKIETDTFAALKDAVTKSLDGMGFKAEDFGDALK